MNDLIGRKFGRLIVLKRMDNNKWGKSCWLCQCNCGKEKIIPGYNLTSKRTQSCGCLNKEISAQCNTKHGHNTKTEVSQIYQSWRGMIQRCINPNNEYYHYYGGRGITVCKRWRKFENFLDDMGEPPTTKHTLDRIDNDGNYCKSNCRWATRKQQQQNKQNNLFITHEDRTQLLVEWAKEYKIDYSTLRARIYQLNWPIKKALITPVRRKRKK